MKTRTVVIAAVAAAGLLFLGVIALCGGLIYVGYQSADTDISPRIDAIFASIEDGTLGDVYDTQTTAEFRTVTTKDQFQQLGETIHGRLGALVDKNLTTYNFRQQNTDTQVEVAYDATFENGTGDIEAAFQRNGGDWLLVRLFVNSPVFKQDLTASTCPHCGKTHTGVAQFCPHCGKPLSASPEDGDPSDQPSDQP